MSPDMVDLTSMAAVIALTTLIVQGIKQAVAEVTALRHVPIYVYSVIVAMLLTFLATKVFGTLNGHLGPLLFQAVIYGLGAGGFFTLREALLTVPADKKAQADSEPDHDATPMSWLLIAGCMAALLGSGGCTASPAFVRGVEAQWKPIKSDYVDYVTTDTRLDDQGKQIRLESVKAMDELIAAEKAQEQSSGAATQP